MWGQGLGCVGIWLGLMRGQGLGCVGIWLGLCGGKAGARWGQGWDYVGTIFNQQNQARSTAYLCWEREIYTSNKTTATQANLSAWGMNLLMHSCTLCDPQNVEQLKRLLRHIPTSYRGEKCQSQCTYNIRPNRSCTPLWQSIQERISCNVLIIYARIGLVPNYDRQHRNVSVAMCL